MIMIMIIIIPILLLNKKIRNQNRISRCLNPKTKCLPKFVKLKGNVNEKQQRVQDIFSLIFLRFQKSAFKLRSTKSRIIIGQNYKCKISGSCAIFLQSKLFFANVQFTFKCLHQPENTNRHFKLVDILATLLTLSPLGENQIALVSLRTSSS